MMHRYNIYNKVSVMMMLTMMLVGVSCSREDGDELGSRQTSIAFSAYVGQATKAVQTDIDNSNLGDFTVTAIGNGGFYFKNETFTKNETTSEWATSVPYYWPSYSLNFYAYTKPSTTSTTVNATNVKPGNKESKRTLSVTVSTSMSNQEDLVAAYASNVSSSTIDGAYGLTFKHILTRVTVQARCMNKNYKVMVKGVKLTNMNRKGSYRFSNNKMSVSTDTTKITDFSVKYDSKEKYWITLNSPTETVSDPAYINVMQSRTATTTGRWYLIPQTVTSWAQATDQTNTNNGTYLGLWVKITTQKGTKIFPADKTWTATNEWAWMAVEIPEDLKFEQGKKYTVSLNFFSATGKGAGFQDPEEDGPVKPGKGNSAVGSTNLILFGTKVNEWSDEVGVTIDL